MTAEIQLQLNPIIQTLGFTNLRQLESLPFLIKQL